LVAFEPLIFVLCVILVVRNHLFIDEWSEWEQSPFSFKRAIRRVAVLRLALLSVKGKSLAEQNPHSHYNVPTSLAPLIGRECEREAICALLASSSVRLLTLTGTGGVGKTRLALAVADCSREIFTDGICFVSLSAISDPELVVTEIAQALAQQTGNRPIFEIVQAYLQDKSLLLILDNFEQVISATSYLSALLASCPHLKLLVTSREALRIQGEHQFLVAPLDVPDLKQSSDLPALLSNASVMLFAQYAQSVKHDFQVVHANARTIAEICVRLEGVPLALELAAARVKLLSPTALLARLSHRLQVLTRGRNDAPDRQQTLLNTIKWSYDLLFPEEQLLFRRLCVFVGGCTLQAIEALTHMLGDDPSLVLEGVASLVDKNLMRMERLDEEEGRIQLLECVREFGLTCLQEHNELERLQQAHMQYYLNWAEVGGAALFGVKQVAWMKRLVQELANLRATMRQLVERQDTEAALRLGVALGPSWLLWGHHAQQVYLLEGKLFLEQALTNSTQLVMKERGAALALYGTMVASLGERVRGEELCRQGLAILRQLGDTQYIIGGLWLLLRVLLPAGDFRAAYSLAQEVLDLLQQAGEHFIFLGGATWACGYSLLLAGWAALYNGYYAQARAWLEQSYRLCCKIDDLFDATGAHLLLGEVALCEGKMEEARVLLEECRMSCERLGMSTGAAEANCLLGRLALYEGDIANARMCLQESLRLWSAGEDKQGVARAYIWLARLTQAEQELQAARKMVENALSIAISIHDRLHVAIGLETLGSVVVLQDEPVWAVHLWAAANALREVMGCALAPIERQEHEDRIAVVRAMLGEANFQAMWRQGLRMSPEQACSAHGVHYESASVVALPTRPDEPEASASPSKLTRREREVMKLLIEGLTNAQIARCLVLSTVTVNAYLRSIYVKLGVSSRTQAMRIVIDQHLLNEQDN
jgi:predicted ATPase/DNA-binding CsgD family transcriptional regulator